MQIYKISFDKTDKVYIGVSKNTAENRLVSHKSGEKSLISKAIREYGNPIVNILKETSDIEELYLFEQIYIAQFNSLHPNGFNMVSGGIGVHGLDIKEFKSPGRPVAHSLLKKRMIAIRLPEWLIKWMDDQPGTNRAILIEEAIQKIHKIHPPKLDNL